MLNVILLATIKKRYGTYIKADKKEMQMFYAKPNTEERNAGNEEQNCHKIHKK